MTRRQLTRVAPHQTAKVVAITFALFSLLVVVPLTLLAALPFDDLTYFAAIVVLPVFHLIFGYLGVGALCLIYNAVAKRVGGVSYETGDDPG